MAGKTLVAYFSATGETARVARKVAEAVGADLYEIRPAQPYTEKDLDWTDKRSRSSVEMKDQDSRPGISSDIPDADGYGTILVGFPVWWNAEPRIVDTFLDAIGTEGRRIAAFATSGGTGIEGSERHLRKLYPDADWVKGRLLNDGRGAEWASGIVEE